MKAQEAAQQARAAAAARARLARQEALLRAEAAQRAKDAAAAAAAAAPGDDDADRDDTTPTAPTPRRDDDDAPTTTTTDAARPPPPTTAPVSGGHPEAASIALQYLGIPYQWGGASPGTGFDCSGLVMYVYAQLGVQLPHFAAGQYGFGSAVSRDQLQPGDLVFFDGLSHVGIYIGNGQMVHAPQTGDVVKITAALGLRHPLRRSQADLSSKLVNLVRLRRIRFSVSARARSSSSTAAMSSPRAASST